MAFFEQGEKTLMVDGDLYKGTLSSVWQNQSKIGLASITIAPQPLNTFGIPVGD